MRELAHIVGSNPTRSTAQRCASDSEWCRNWQTGIATLEAETTTADSATSRTTLSIGRAPFFPGASSILARHSLRRSHGLRHREWRSSSVRTREHEDSCAALNVVGGEVASQPPFGWEVQGRSAGHAGRSAYYSRPRAEVTDMTKRAA